MGTAAAGSEQVVHPGEHAWYTLAEHRWRILAEHAWYIFGEHQWCILGEHRWYIYTRLLTSFNRLAQNCRTPRGHPQGEPRPHLVRSERWNLWPEKEQPLQVSQLRDYFARYILEVPAGISPGPLRLEMTVNDLLGEKSAAVALPLEVVGEPELDGERVASDASLLR